MEESDFLTEEDFADIAENLHGEALELFSQLVEHGANRGRFYRELRSSHRRTLERVREELQAHGSGYSPIDIRKSEVAKEEGETRSGE